MYVLKHDEQSFAKILLLLQASIGIGASYIKYFCTAHGHLLRVASPCYRYWYVRICYYL